VKFVAVFGSGIRDKHPGSGTLLKKLIDFQKLVGAGDSGEEASSG
jgi:hypothetical protein